MHSLLFVINSWHILFSFVNFELKHSGSFSFQSILTDTFLFLFWFVFHVVFVFPTKKKNDLNYLLLLSFRQFSVYVTEVL